MDKKKGFGTHEALVERTHSSFVNFVHAFWKRLSCPSTAMFRDVSPCRNGGCYFETILAVFIKVLVGHLAPKREASHIEMVTRMAKIKKEKRHMNTEENVHLCIVSQCDKVHFIKPFLL